ncbi:hypothetical protein PoB_004963100 [Plakobranchus ocellatus]|uniref:Uncharacterized protein n=1 Tax=Plakobranchus ocellatus TaxID=259542 RepID=A0AAV4BIF9_9GAST|nr:hypothetical protein PoB_004963100 [Plakobranchus ocellatus]
MSDHSRDVHQSFERAFQKVTLKEIELIDPSFLAHIVDILSELGTLENEKPIASSSLTLTYPKRGEMLPRPISPDLSILEKLIEELLPTMSASTTESIFTVPVESFLIPMTHTYY